MENCCMVYTVAGPTLSRQPLLAELFLFECKLISIFVSLLGLSTRVSRINTLNASLMALQY